MTAPAQSPRSLTLLAQTVLCAVAVVCLLYLPIPILPYLEQTYQLEQGQAGLALSAFSAAYASGYVMFGVLSDRFGRKAVVVGGLLALTVITLAMVWLHENAPSWQGFVALRVLQGWAASVFPPAALVHVAGRGNASQRMWAVTWMGAAFFSAGLLGQIYGLQVVVPLGVGWALCLLAVVYVLTAVRYLFVKEEKPVQPQQILPARKPLWRSLWDSYRPIFRLLRHRDLWRADAVLFCGVLPCAGHASDRCHGAGRHHAPANAHGGAAGISDSPVCAQTDAGVWRAAGTGHGPVLRGVGAAALRPAGAACSGLDTGRQRCICGRHRAGFAVFLFTTG